MDTLTAKARPQPNQQRGKTEKMQAIQTKYICPTNFRGSRIKATCAAGSIMPEWNDALNSEENHKLAAETLRDKFKWKGELIGGSLKNGSYVWVFAQSTPTNTR